MVQVFIPPAPTMKMAHAFGKAMGIVSASYADIGVRIEWKSIASSPPGCSRQDLMRRTVVVSFQSVPLDGMAKEALAFAQPFVISGPCVALLLPRIQLALEVNPASASTLLGHVLAHGLGHYLQGAVRHSEMGVMKARWSVDEWMGMGRQRLRFSPDDARWIRGRDEPVRQPANTRVEAVRNLY